MVMNDVICFPTKIKTKKVEVYRPPVVHLIACWTQGNSSSSSIHFQEKQPEFTGAEIFHKTKQQTFTHLE